MKNYIHRGDYIEVTAPYALTSGQGCQVGTMFGVATTDAANGAPVVLCMRGVVELNKLNTDVIGQGVSCYWDNTNRRVTVSPTAPGNNLYIGKAVTAVGNPSTSVRVAYDGIVSKVVG